MCQVFGLPFLIEVGADLGVPPLPANVALPLLRCKEQKEQMCQVFGHI